MREKDREQREQLIKEIKELRLENPKEAYSLCQELLALGIRERDQESVAAAYQHQGYICYGRGAFSHAIAFLKKAIQIQKEEKQEEQLIVSYNILACIHFNENDELMGIEYLLRALDLAEKWKQYYYLAMLYNNLGELCFQFYDLEKAIQYYSEAYEYNKESERLGMGSCISKGSLYVNFAHCYLRAEAVDKALEYYKQAMEHMEEWELLQQYFGVRACGAQIYYAKGDRETASSICSEVLAKLLVSDCYLYEFFTNLIDVAELFMKLEEWEKAWKMIDRLEMLSQMEGNMGCLNRVYELHIQYHQKRKDINRESLLGAYRGFYQTQKRMEDRIRHATATAINNRFALENEHEEYERLQKEHDMLEQSSLRDGLTGINNRYALNRFFEKNFTITKEKNLTFGIMIMDIDYFKQYNDKYGHLRGDDCIRQVSHRISETALGSFCARYGGDEFFVITIGKENEDFLNLATRLVEGVRDLEIPFERPDQTSIVTISLGGINAIPWGFQTVTDFIHQADTVLYQVKKHRKNCGKVIFSIR